MRSCAIRAVLPALALASAAWAAEPAGAKAATPDPKIRIFVSIPPQATFVERVGGTHVAVDVLVAPGQSPHAYEPTPKQMAQLAEARLFFGIGWPFEKRVLAKVTATNPHLVVVDTREGVPLRRMTAAEARLDDHGRAAAREDGHAAGLPAGASEPDPHIWLNPRYVKIQAATICRALQAAGPAHAAEYQKNLDAFAEDLDGTDARIAAALAPLKGREFLVFHPAFGYFADAYGLRQMPVEIEGKEPGARQLAALIDRARADGVKVIFVQPQFSARSAEAVARAIGGAVVPIDPLARDYLANLEDMADKIRRALQPGPSPQQP